MGQVTNSMAKGERTYLLKVQSGYNGSDREWHGKGRRYIHAEGAERVRSKMAGKGRKDAHSGGAEQV